MSLSFSFIQTKLFRIYSLCKEAPKNDRYIVKDANLKLAQENAEKIKLKKQQLSQQ